jgi:hypothetical protein
VSISTPITIAIGSDTFTCNLINNDNYGSEYFGVTTGSEVTVRIRHARLKPGASGVNYDSHNVEITQTVYADGTTPEFQRKCYVVLQNKRNDDATAAVDAWESLVDFLTDTHLADLLAWIH